MTDQTKESVDVHVAKLTEAARLLNAYCMGKTAFSLDKDISKYVYLALEQGRQFEQLVQTMNGAKT
jgi:hypothetical protein